MNPDHRKHGEEQAALYATGALEPAESAAFENHLREGCTSCQDDLKDFQAVAAALVEACPEYSPGDGVRGRLMARVTGVPGLTTQRSDEASWQATEYRGIKVRRLSVDRKRGTVSLLVKLAAGARYPRHRHAAVEQCYVIEGDLRTSETVLLAGDFQRAEPDTVHGDQWSENGCTALIISSIHNEFF